MPPGVIALLMARGPAKGNFGPESPKYKALLPLRGRPMADFVLCALQESPVEKIFVVQAEDAHLEAVLTPHEKNIFVDISLKDTSLAWTLLRALEQVMDYYGIAEFQKRLLMLVPCDIPLVTAAGFDCIIQQAQHLDTDVTITGIPSCRLSTCYPHKRFQRLYLQDRGEEYCLQSIILLNGRRFNYRHEPAEKDCRLVLLDVDGKPIPALDVSIDIIRTKRNSLFLWLHFLYEMFVRRMIRNGHAVEMLHFLFTLAIHRLTINRINTALRQAFGVVFGMAESSMVEFSADIDTREDYALTLDLINSTVNSGPLVASKSQSA